jgi:hypothetical protein
VRNVNFSHVLELLEAFEFHPSQADFASQPLREFIARAAEEGTLANWNIAIICNGPKSSTESVELAGLEVRTVVRSRLDGCGQEANIKALMSRQNVLADCDAGDEPAEDSWEALKAYRRTQLPRTGLLLIYPIDRISTPSPRAAGSGTSQRIPLDAENVVIGLGMVLPAPEQSRVTTAVYMTQDRSDQILETPEDVPDQGDPQ